MRGNKKPLISGRIHHIFDNCPTGLDITELSKMVMEGKAREAKEKIDSHIHSMKVMNGIIGGIKMGKKIKLYFDDCPIGIKSSEIERTSMEKIGIGIKMIERVNDV